MIAYKTAALNYVTPFVGVWIETYIIGTEKDYQNVTPFVGVWIETLSTLQVSSLTSSHTLRGCVD